MLNCYSLNIKLNYHSLDIICHLNFDINYNVLDFNITYFLHSHYYKMWVQFTSPRLLDQRIHCFLTNPHSLQ
jgi:hypothetical protein